MIFKQVEDKLYEVIVKIEDEIFVKHNKGYIVLQDKDLPKQNKNDTRSNLKLFYKYDDDKNIILDNERINKEWILDLKQRTKNHIYNSYPEEKQNQDSLTLVSLEHKISYYFNVLKIKEDIKSKMVKYILSYKDTKSINNSLKDIDKYKISKEHKKILKQLIFTYVKIGLKIQWVDDVKDEHKLAIKELREPNYQNFIEIKE